MGVNRTAPLAAAGCTAWLLGMALGPVVAHGQAPATTGAPPAQAGGRGGGRGGVAPALFTAADADKDGALTRDELKGAFTTWFAQWDRANAGSITQAQLAAGLASAVPQPAANIPSDPCGGRSSNPRVPCQADVDRMMAALPDKAPARPQKPRRILVLGRAAGFVHSSIPLAARTVEEMGKKTAAWTTTITYDAADINAGNLKQYDAIFLDSTTGCFLDDPSDKAATDARRAALLEFIRGGKGIAAIHAASDSYHGASCGGGAAAGGGATGALATAIMNDGDKNGDQKLTREELTALTDAWYDKLDPDRAGRVSQADFATRWGAVVPTSAPGGAGQRAGGAPTVPGGQPLWPEWNRIIGGYFKFHWVDPQLITVKIDDPKSPLTAMFHGQGFEIRDETYTYNQESFSRDNVHVLTSIDYAKMSDEDKAKETNPRSDHDYALSWIRREGKGRLFYEAHGHHERVYAMKPMLEHVLAGIQYALGDLKADDTPGTKVGTK